MKYMHFKASCSYTALAALMEAAGVQTEDREIALEMQLPWLFAKEGDAWLSGPMLQGARWFDLWLRPRGFRMLEVSVDRSGLCPYLRADRPVMLGIRTPYGKHAVVCRGYDGHYHFFNPTYENSGEPTELVLTEYELLASVEHTVVLGALRPAEPTPQDVSPLLASSISVLRDNCAAIAAFAAREHAPDVYPSMLDPLFRPLLLDCITMLALADEHALAQGFAALQRQLMAFLRGPRTQPLAQALSLRELHELAEQYVRRIEQQLSAVGRVAP